MNFNSLCPGCMREIENPDSVCPYCGFFRKEYESQRNLRVLPTLSILFGRYLLGRTLGEGGFGITYIAKDLAEEKTVAIKEYFPVGLAVRDAINGNMNLSCVTGGDKRKYYQHGLKSFAEEAKNMQRFRSLSGVVSVMDFFYENGTAYLVMEYIDGMSLKQYLRKKMKPLPENAVLSIMRPIMYALSNIHKVGMIHRDVSPENIMLAKDGRVVLIDFGAARNLTGAETQSLTIILKQGYAPVEQYQTRGRQGPWSDVYAVCATMYRMLSGSVPAEAVERISKDKVLPLYLVTWNGRPLGISRRISDIIRKGLAVYPQNRYQNAQELLDALYPEEKKIELPPPEENEAEKYEKSSIQLQPVQNDNTGMFVGLWVAIALVIILLICWGISI